MDKKKIRNIYIKKRENLSLEDIRQHSDRINSFVESIISKIQPKVVHCFLPIRHKLEFDTTHIFNYCWSKKIITLIPVSNFKTNEMSSVLYTKETKTSINKWGIPEPNPLISKAEELPDIVFTPLLAFNSKGYRVGYGKGFYDKFFSSLDRKPLVIGISFFDAIEQIDDLNELDIPLDYCITPKEIITF